MKTNEQIAFFLVVIFALFCGVWTGAITAWTTTYRNCAATGQYKVESFIFTSPLVIECKIVVAKAAP